MCKRFNSYLVHQAFAPFHGLCLQAETCQVPVPNKVTLVRNHVYNTRMYKFLKNAGLGNKKNCFESQRM